MITLPHNAQKITVSHASVEFYEFKENNTDFIYFDTSLCAVPEPMINAMAGLQMVQKSNKKLIMINHTIPNGLFPKIKENFNYEVNERNDGNFEIIFEYKNNTSLTTNFDDTGCSG